MATQLYLQEIKGKWDLLGVAQSGILPTVAATNVAGNWCKAPRHSRTFLWIDNNAAGVVTVNLIAQKRDDAGVLNTESFAITNGTERIVGPFRDTMVDADGQIHLTYTNADAACLIGVFQIGAD